MAPNGGIRDPHGEQSPLLPRQTSAQRRDYGDIEPALRRLDGGDDERDGESKSPWYLLLLVLSLGGLQIVWSVELSNGSPYLLSLGMSKSLLALVWIAGPVTGVLVQPYVGIRSDNCRVSWGKRKPFMLGGGGATILSLLALSRAREIMTWFLGLFGAVPGSLVVKNGTIAFAIIFMYVLDFSINTVQAAIRAFIVDNAPTHQQESANAWASRISGCGNILGYISSYADLPRALPFFGNTQFKVLCVIACLALGSTLLVSCFYIKERDPRLEGPPAKNPGVVSFFVQIFHSIRRLPPQIRKICEVQFFNWIGWFPFLFYITTYIGQLYVNPILESHPRGELTNHDIDVLWERATRVGAFALLIFAIVSFINNTFLPFLIVPTYKPQPFRPASLPQGAPPVSPRSTFSGLSRSSSAAGLASFASAEIHADEPRPRSVSARLSHYLTYLQIPGLTLRRAWLIAHVLFAACMFSTFFIRTPFGATILTGVVGICWSLTVWAPFALIGAEISRRETLRRLRRRQASEAAATLVARPNSEDIPYAANIRPIHDHNDADTCNLQPKDTLLPEDGDLDNSTDQAGVILGLHNVAISSPQILATLLSSAIFRALQRDRGTPGDDSVGWVLRVSGLAAIGAAVMTSRLREGDGGVRAGGDGADGDGDEAHYGRLTEE